MYYEKRSLITNQHTYIFLDTKALWLCFVLVYIEVGIIVLLFCCLKRRLKFALPNGVGTPQMYLLNYPQDTVIFCGSYLAISILLPPKIYLMDLPKLNYGVCVR